MYRRFGESFCFHLQGLILCPDDGKRSSIPNVDTNVTIYAFEPPDDREL
jgi:hypothetical protein